MRRPSRPCSGRGAGGIGAVPLRAADGSQEDGVGLAAVFEDLVGEGRAQLVDRRAADRALDELELADRAQQLAGGPDDLGSDAVAGEDDDAGL